MRKLVIHICTVIIFFSCIVVINRIWITEFTERPVLISPAKSIRHFTLGYDDLLADVFWLRVIQDYGMCEHALRAKSNAQGQTKMGKNRVQDCKKGWVFRMLDVISDLAPKFRMPQASGGIMLSVIIDDIEGASIIFDKATKNFPNDWSILYRAAYHALYEEEDEQKAASLFRRAGTNGAPFWVNSLSARLYSKTGRAEFAYKVIADYIKNFGDQLEEAQLDSLKNRLKELSVQVRNQ